MTSRFAVPTQWCYSFILSLQLCIKQSANKICKVGAILKILSVRLAETQYYFFRPCTNKQYCKTYRYGGYFNLPHFQVNRTYYCHQIASSLKICIHVPSGVLSLQRGLWGSWLPCDQILSRSDKLFLFCVGLAEPQTPANHM